ncbi:hypothetical protein [Streptomyces sp. NPDC059080]|uniref:hypothetical protein n=1 Tax=Streptomyces sp. NPDC059080 TaxID=3346718 RepID=UPI003676FBE0
MGTDWTWGQALKAFAATGQKVTDSSEIGTNSGPSWFVASMSDGGVSADASQSFDPHYDVWWSFNYVLPEARSEEYGGSDRAYVLGINMDWATLDSSGGPLYRFFHQAEEILSPLSGTLKGNEFVSLGSFDTASNTARWLEGRIQAAKELIDSWARTIDNDDSNWQGSSAGVFRAVLEGHAKELERLRTEMINPRDFTGDIDQARVQLHQTLAGLQEAFGNWYNDRLAAPVNATHDALQEAMQGVSITFDGQTPKVTGSKYGDPATQEFWDQVQSRAKEMWLTNVRTKLDEPAQTHMQALERSYGSTTAAIPEALSPLRLKLPHAVNPLGGPNKGGGGDQNLASLLNKNKTGDGSPPDLKQFNAETGTGVGGGIGGGDTGGGAGGGTGIGGGTGADVKPPSVDDIKQQFAQQNGGGVGGGQDGKGGDQHGQLPPGGFVPPPPPKVGSFSSGVADKNGGKDGLTPGSAKSPLVGANGEPLKDKNGKALSVPYGSKINADGTVTRPDGKLATDSAGHKITGVPPGAKITSPAGMGTGNGTGNSLAHQEFNANKKLAEYLQKPPGSNGPGGGTPPPPLPNSLKTFSGGGMGGGLGGGAGGGAGEGPIARNLARTGNDFLRTNTGMSPTALRNGGSVPPSEELPPGGGRGGGRVLSEATAGGRNTSSGSPMVPPMGGGGGAGGGGQGEQGRQRQTWIDEDEEVWGTDEGTTPGVIGR